MPSLLLPLLCPPTYSLEDIFVPPPRSILLQYLVLLLNSLLINDLVTVLSVFISPVVCQLSAQFCCFLLFWISGKRSKDPKDLEVKQADPEGSDSPRVKSKLRPKKVYQPACQAKRHNGDEISTPVRCDAGLAVDMPICRVCTLKFICKTSGADS